MILELDSLSFDVHFEQMVKDFIALNKRQEVPVTSVGSCWRFTTSDLNSMINEAEANMYRDKNEFYKRFPEFKRQADLSLDYRGEPDNDKQQVR